MQDEEQRQTRRGSDTKEGMLGRGKGIDPEGVDGELAITLYVEKERREKTEEEEKEST